jgi:DNA-binding MarR family transcriptional regulator
VAGKLVTEIKQTKPFALIEEEAALNIVRTAEVLNQRNTEFFREYGLSGTQYNVLRILRGAGSSGIMCSQLADRMIAKDPDITRLLDRMEARGLVVRGRSTQDRRVVVTHISRKGLELVNTIDQPLAAMLKRTIGKTGKQQLSELIEQLEQVREHLA